MTDRQWKKAAKLVDSFYHLPDAEPFRVPVDWKAYGLLDYPKLVKRPMDLGTIKNNLKAKSYTSLHRLNADVTLVWTNCMTYNEEGSDFHRIADALHQLWDGTFSRILHEAYEGGPAPAPVPARVPSSGVPSSGVPSSGAPSLREKRDFAKQLFGLTLEELGRVLAEVDARCPAAVALTESDDGLELNVDRISGPVLRELTNLVEEVGWGGKT